jgi:hypothetical protein
VADWFEARSMAGPGALVVMAPFLGPCKYPQYRNIGGKLMDY